MGNRKRRRGKGENVIFCSKNEDGVISSEKGTRWDVHDRYKIEMAKRKDEVERCTARGEIEDEVRG